MAVIPRATFNLTVIVALILVIVSPAVHAQAPSPAPSNDGSGATMKMGQCNIYAKEVATVLAGGLLIRTKKATVRLRAASRGTTKEGTMEMQVRAYAGVKGVYKWF